VGEERTIVAAGNAGHLAVRDGDAAGEGVRETAKRGTVQESHALQHSLSRPLPRDKHFLSRRGAASAELQNPDGNGVSRPIKCVLDRILVVSPVPRAPPRGEAQYLP